MKLANPKKVIIEDGLEPISLIVSDKFCAVLDRKDIENTVKVYNLDSWKLVHKFVPRGRGTGEMINPSILTMDSLNNVLWVASVPPGSMLGLELRDLETSKP